MADPITDYYADTPSSSLTQNQRIWYDPIVADQYRRKSVYYGLVPFNMKDLGAVRATEVVVTETTMGHANFDPLGVRTLWTPAMHIDSRNRKITMNRH